MIKGSVQFFLLRYTALAYQIWLVKDFRNTFNTLQVSIPFYLNDFHFFQMQLTKAPLKTM